MDNRIISGTSSNLQITVFTTIILLLKQIFLPAPSLCLTTVIYNGTEKKPLIKVRYGNKTLVENSDYQILYQNNPNVGKASVTFTGIGAYTGTLTAFLISHIQLIHSQFSKDGNSLTETGIIISMAFDRLDGLSLSTPGIIVNGR